MIHYQSSINNELSLCTDSINVWLLRNNLLLNTNKTELINISISPNRLPIVNVYNIHNIHNIQINRKSKVKNVGVIFDKKLSFVPQINSLYKSANVSLYKIKSIRKLITHKTCKILIHSLVFTYIDYVNSQYNRLPKCMTNTVDKIIRSSICTIHNIKFYNHISISSLQNKLQLLSLKDRAFLKSVSLVHNIIYSNTYNILSEMISYYRPLSSLRSAKSVKLNLPKYNYETIMVRSFYVSAPTNWNKLPEKLRCEIKYNIFLRKVKLFFININIVLYLFIEIIYINMSYFFIFICLIFIIHEFLSYMSNVIRFIILRCNL